MLFPYGAIFVATLSVECVLAQPHHKHHHHQQKRGIDYNDPSLYKDVDWDKVFHKDDVKAKSSPVADAPSSVVSPSPAHSSPPAAVSPVESPASTHGSEKPKGKDLSSGGFGGQTVPIDDGIKDHYIGNVGSPYGSNMILISESDESKFKYTNKICSDSGKDIDVIVWNKSGEDKKPNSGQSLPPNLKFTIAPGGCQTLAFDENTQAAYSKDCGRDPGKGNVPMCPWAEVDFGNQGNGGWSGYDVSTIAAGPNTGKMNIKCDGAKTSSDSENGWTAAQQADMGAGGSKPPGEVHFQTTFLD